MEDEGIDHKIENSNSLGNISSTKSICRHYARGYCAYDDKCKFIHCSPGSDEFVRIFGDVEYVESKTKLCRHFTAGFCALGDQCKFIHSLRARTGRFIKHSLSSHHYPQRQPNESENQTGTNAGINTEKNSSQALIPKYDESQDGAFEVQQNQSLNNPKIKQEVCRFYYNTGTCKYGQKCHYLHQRNASYPQMQQNYFHPVINVIPSNYSLSSMDGLAAAPMFPVHGSVAPNGNSINNPLVGINKNHLGSFPNSMVHGGYKNMSFFPQPNFIMHQKVDENHNPYYQNQREFQAMSQNVPFIFDGLLEQRAYENTIANNINSSEDYAMQKADERN